MSELQEKVKKSIERLKAFCPEEGYYLAFSGGKDSVVCKALLDMSDCKYDATYSVTSVDPPELVRFIKNQHSDVQRAVPRYSEAIKAIELRGKPITMWNLIPMKRFPPTRWSRYCCQYLKESGGDGRMVVTGVRWAESASRAASHGAVTIRNGANTIDDRTNFKETKFGGVITNNDNTETRRVVETCYKRHKTTVNPIIEWNNEEVWQFIKTNGIPYCELYDEGFTRLGCVGCPLASTKEREKELFRWSKFKGSYLYAFSRMLQARLKNNDPFNLYGNTFETATDVFNWWMRYDVLPGQIDWFEDYEEEG